MRNTLLIPLLITIFFMSLAQCNLSQDLRSGKEIYQVYCVNCHGVDGRLATNGALDLSRSRLPMEARIQTIKNGRVTMMGYDGVLTEEQIDSVARYSMELQK